MPKSRLQLLGDSFKNLVAGLGTSRDKQTTGDYSLLALSDEQFLTIYRVSWMARKTVDIPAEDSTREWREWQAEKEQIEAIVEEERRLGLQAKTKLALQQARLFGGSGIYFSIKGQDPAEPLDLERVGAGDLEFCTVLSRDILTAGDIENDPILENYGKPKYYEVSSATGGVQRIHPSRLAIFKGNETLLPERTAGTNKGWGDSILQSAYEAVRNADSTASNIASLVYESKIDILQIPDLGDIMANPVTREKLIERVELSALLKGTNGMLVLDTEENYDQKTFSFAGLPEINMQALQAVCGAADIPITRFLGQSPGGLNSTGESDLVNYYNGIGAMQTLEISPALHNLDESLIRSVLGNRPEEIYYKWASLWQMSAEQKAKISLDTSNMIKLLVEAQLFPEDELAIAAANLLVQHSILPSFEISEAADLEEEEEEENAAI